MRTADIRVSGLALVITALTCAGAFAQEAAPTQPVVPPPGVVVAPNAPVTMPSPGGGGGDGMANICNELVAFVQQHQAKDQTKDQAKDQGQQGGSQSQSNVATQAPSSGGSQKESGGNQPAPGTTTPMVDKAQEQSGITAPVTPPQSANKPPSISLQQAQDLAGKNDLKGCRDAAQGMRRAGIVMPDALIALAAMRPDLLQGGQHKP
jgi:hypothetical protein